MADALLDKVLAPKRGAATPAAPAAGPAKPKRPSRERKPKRKPDAKRIKAALGGILLGADKSAAKLFPRYWTEEDRLSMEETVCAVEGIYSELEQHPSWLDYCMKALDAQGHGELLAAAVVIAAPRLARHGVIPRELGPIFSGFAHSMASGGAPDAGRPDGDGQEHAGGSAAPEPEVPGSPEVQAGQGEVPGPADGTEGFGDGQSAPFFDGASAEV
ncbi:MAG TPA: hypothetical protein VKU60_19880 [Chloroflexota bacterium]|nr:hypothetical protein [Chloroflexota bacterium]